MPQSPLAFVAKGTSGGFASGKVDSSGLLLTSAGGLTPVYDITTPTVIKASAGRVIRIVVQAAGSTTGTVNDCLTTGAAAIGNQVAVIPETVGPISLDWPCLTGIVVVPGTGQILSVAYA